LFAQKTLDHKEDGQGVAESNAVPKLSSIDIKVETVLCEKRQPLS
jgi:hypothetical protein